MTREKVINAFWSGFGLKAYDETTVPDMEPFPYITHEGALDTFGNEVAQTASVWDRSTSWSGVYDVLTLVERALPKGGVIVPYDGGAVLIRRGDPWAQRMADSTDDMVRRLLLNYTVEYIE